MQENNQFICQLIYKAINSELIIYRSVIFGIEASAATYAYQNALITASQLLFQNPILKQHTFVGIALLEVATNQQQFQPLQFNVHPEKNIQEQRVRQYQDDLIKNLGYCA